MDPKNEVDRILGALKAKGLKGKKLWARVCDFGQYLEDTAKSTPTGPKSAMISKRKAADILKVSAMLLELAEQHAALEREPISPGSVALDSALDEVKDILKDR